ncbi:MAG: chromosomal replication initiator protein DnaA [Ktedonobacteraceae bacterium]|nr:chromosomal replication initiator protein DnaA [Ktedonobacteraceae bacterium]
MNARQIWQTTIDKLQTKVNHAVFTTWFQGTSALSYQNGVFIVRVPTTFAKAQLEGRFIESIRSLLSEVTNEKVDVQFVVTKESTQEEEEAAEDETQSIHKRSSRLPKSRTSAEQSEKRTTVTMNSMAPLMQQASVRRGPEVEETVPVVSQEDPAGSVPAMKLSTSEGILNPRYTFSAFIVGKSNQLAHAASLAVAENPGRIYNPLFFYGGVGLGKTHLLHAVGHVGLKAGLNVLYVTSEKFTNEIINAIRFQKTEEFRAKYRQIDVLLVDDIQFIAGKESTEEEFFHTFNTLHNANKQIVVTSDRPPKAIHSLQDRLRSRFEWGLLADIHPPEYEHRLAILRAKTEVLRFPIPPGVSEYIARPECNSVRELEGALNRVIAYATLHNEPITVNLAAQALEHLYRETKLPAPLTVAEVLQAVCHYYNVDPDVLRGKQRSREIVWPRQVAMYLMREETDASLLQIGTELGGRDHTTIMHGWEKVYSEMSNNDRVHREVSAVLGSLQHN